MKSDFGFDFENDTVMEDEMAIECSWCGDMIKGKGEAISHGICRACYLKLMKPKLQPSKGPAQKSGDNNRAAPPIVLIRNFRRK